MRTITIGKTTIEYPEEILANKREVNYDPNAFDIKINGTLVSLDDLGLFIELLLNERLNLYQYCVAEIRL